MSPAETMGVHMQESLDLCFQDLPRLIFFPSPDIHVAAPQDLGMVLGPKSDAYPWGRDKVSGDHE